MIVAIDCSVRYLHLVLILACEILGASHGALAESDMDGDCELTTRCDFLCAITYNDRVAKFPNVLRLSSGFIGTMSAVAIHGDDLASLEYAYPGADIVRIARTSGTTGRSRFMGNTRRALRNIIDNLPYMLKFDDLRQNFVSLHSFIQMSTYSDSLLALRSGSTVIYCRGNELVANVRKLAACHTVLLVVQAAELARTAQMGDGRLDTLSIRVIGGYVPPALRSALRETVTAEVCSTYSMNETSYITTNEDDGPGHLLPDISVRIVDDAGNGVALGKPGIIMARTPRMVHSYLWGGQSEQDFVDGWFRTSDVGYVPEPGRLVVLGRSDDMLNLGGLKVAPHPIEERIKSIEGVIDAVLVGIDDALGNPTLHVVVERDDPALDGHVEAQIVPLIVGYATSFELRCVDRLPRARMGKIQRSLLKQLIARGSK